VPGRLTSVSIKVGSGFNMITPDQFARLPVNERIELVMQHKVVFLDDAGQHMNVTDAIEQLTKLRAAPAPSSPKPKPR
jgi:hypothetical protein